MSWNADTPTNTSVGFQVAVSNNINGPFNFVGPDGTAGTFFNTSGASLAQFSGSRYLKYKAYLSTTDGAVAPTLNDVTVCFSNVLLTALQTSSATGVRNGTVELSATLKSSGSGLPGKAINFSLNGTSAGSAITDSNGVATLTGASMYGIAPGSYPNAVSASFTGDPSYAPSSGTASLTVLTTQTITFGALSDKTFGDADFPVSATASSGLTTRFSAGGSCTISGTLVHILGAGTCTITASQTGDATFAPAPDVPESFTIAKANQTITFGALADKIFGAADFTVNATATSGLAVVFATTGNCTINNGQVHLAAGGTCTITASQAGNNNFNAAADVPRTFNIAKANQTVTFGALADKTFGAADFTVDATATSGLAVVFAATGNCTINNGTVHLTTAGTCTITASQAGNNNFNAAADVPRTFNIADFSLGTSTGGSTTATVTAGSTAVFNLKASGISGFIGTVTLTCSGAPDKASCSVNPPSVNLSGTATSSDFTVTVTTTAPSGTSIAASKGRGGQNLAWIVPFGGFGAIVLLGSKKRRVRVGGMFAILAVAVCLNGCGNDRKPVPVPGTPKGAFTLTVSATSGGLTHTQQLTMNVQ